MAGKRQVRSALGRRGRLSRDGVIRSKKRGGPWRAHRPRAQAIQQKKAVQGGKPAAAAGAGKAASKPATGGVRVKKPAKPGVTLAKTAKGGVAKPGALASK